VSLLTIWYANFQRLLFILLPYPCSPPYSPFSWLRNFQTCAIVGSRLDYVNSILTSISSRNIHRLQRVQNSLARVVTCLTTNTISALNSLHWLLIQQAPSGRGTVISIVYCWCTYRCPETSHGKVTRHIHDIVLWHFATCTSVNYLTCVLVMT